MGSGSRSRVSPGQHVLFQPRQWWEEHWQGMPEFVQESLMPFHTLTVNFKREEDFNAFVELTNVRVSHHKWCWYPRTEMIPWSKQCWDVPKPINPRYPVYVISKGRADCCLTSKYLTWMRVPHHVVVEPQERDAYAAHVDPRKLLVLPFSNLGQGSIPARNWVWEHAKATGGFRHWILDDNMHGFARLNKNAKILVGSGVIFRVAEDFVDRYENVAMAGFQYEFFASRREVWPPFYFNTRVYSCILLRNDLPYRWRGRYNEDTDLSIRILKDGWCTVLFNALLAKKVGTMTMKGGNMEELYQGDGRLRMAESLVEQHPDLTVVSQKWNRAQHHVNYEPFKYAVNKPRLRPGVKIQPGVNEYGMALRDRQRREGLE